MGTPSTDSMTNTGQEIWKRTLPVWIISNCVGYAAFIGTSYLGGATPFFTVAVGAFLALLQWFAIAKTLRVEWFWIPASIPANTVLLVSYLANDPNILARLPDYVTDRDPHIFSMILKSPFWLGVLGLLQWLALRQSLYRSLVWPLVSAAAGLVGVLIALIVNLGVSTTGELSPFLFWPLFGLIYIPITGITLVMLKTLPKPTGKSKWD